MAENQAAPPASAPLSTAAEDIERIIAEASLYTLKSGLEIRIVRLGTRQLLRLLKILTHGMGPLLARTGLDFNSPGFAQNLGVQLALAFPDAEDETIEFLRSMCEPAGLLLNPRAALSDEEKAFNAELWRKVGSELFNPAPEDTLEIISRIVRIEGPEIQSLGKRLTTLMRSLNLMPDPSVPEAAAQVSGLPGGSQLPSTLSAPSTAGPMSTSSASPSAVSARSSSPSANGVSLPEMTSAS